uniref:Uncharacterized protein n=1 Tax=Lepeophtheirus salmonis TaxID=72036 RepID=A0A0K2TGX4_LEPSM
MSSFRSTRRICAVETCTNPLNVPYFCFPTQDLRVSVKGRFKKNLF